MEPILRDVVFYGLLPIIACLGGYFIKDARDSVEAVRTSLETYKETNSLFRAHVAETYVRKDDNASQFDRIFTMLERIESKLDQKVDKV